MRDRVRVLVRPGSLRVGSTVFALVLGRCAADVSLPERTPVDVAPKGDALERVPTSGSLVVESFTASPMYRELLAVDLATVAQVAVARNPEIELARARVAVRKGQAESAAGVFVPVLSAGLSWERVNGAVRATAGNLVDAAFTTWQPFGLAQLVLNPGKAAYELVAARKRLLAAKHLERAAVVAVLHAAGRQYYDMVLSQTKVDLARRVVVETQELLRILEARTRAGTAVQSELLSAQADLARRNQELVLALLEFERASVALAVTLDLDPTVTLAPSAQHVAPRTLVRDDLPIDELLAIAVEHRDDLHEVRALVGAAQARARAERWNAFGPTALFGGQIGGIKGSADDVAGIGDTRFALHEQSRITAGAGVRLSAGSLGDIATSDALLRGAGAEATRAHEHVRAQIVYADRDRVAQRSLVPLAQSEVIAAEEALRLARRQLEAGTITAFDVLQQESALSRARVSYAESVLRYNQSQIALLAAMGVLEASLLCEEDGLRQ